MANPGDTLAVYKMHKKALSAYDLAETFLGISEVEGAESNPQILAWLQHFAPWVEDDLTAHCAAFVGWTLSRFGLDVPEKPLRARSYLTIGRVIPITQARRGFDLVIFRRKIGDPGPSVLDAKGHVGFYSDHEGNFVDVLGANQDNTVKTKSYLADNLLGVRRVYG